MVECEVGAGVRGRAVTDVHAARLQERQLLCDPLSCPREVLEAWEICIRHPTGAARHHHPERERQRAAARRRCEVRANNACLSALRSRARPRPRSAQRTERRPADEVPRESGEGPRPHGQRRGRGGGEAALGWQRQRQRQRGSEQYGATAAEPTTTTTTLKLPTPPAHQLMSAAVAPISNTISRLESWRSLYLCCVHVRFRRWVVWYMAGQGGACGACWIIGSAGA